MKRKSLAVVLCVLSLLAFFCSCKDKKSNSVVSFDCHPAVNCDFSNLENGLTSDFSSVGTYFGDMEYSKEYVSKDRMIYEIFYNETHLYINGFQLDGTLVTSRCVQFKKQFYFSDFTIVDDHQMVITAIDLEYNAYLIRVVDNEVAEYINLGDKEILKICNYDGGVIALLDKEIILFNSQLIEVNTYLSDDLILDIDVFDDCLYLITHSEHNEECDSETGLYNYDYSIVKMSLNKLKIVDSSEFTVSTTINNTITMGSAYICVSSESDLIVSIDDGILCYSLDSDNAEVLINTGDFGFDSSCMIVDNDNETVSFLTRYYDVISGKDVTAKVSCSTEEANVEKKNLQIGLLDTNDYLEYIYAYNRMSKDTYLSIVKYNINNLKYNDYISLMNNTDALDIIIFNDDMFENLVNNDILLDITDAKIEECSLFDNVMKIGIKDDVRYCYVPSFSVRFLAYNDKLYDSSDFEINKIINRENIYGLTCENTVNEIVNDTYSMFISDMNCYGEIQEETVEKFLNLCSIVLNSDMMETDSFHEIINGYVMWNTIDLDNVRELYSVMSYYDFSMGYIPTWGNDSISIIPSSYIGIVANTDYSEQCEDFLNYILSDSVQNTMSIPSNKKAFDYQIDSFVGNLNEDVAKEIIIENPIYSRYDSISLIDEIEDTIVAMQNGTHSIEMIENQKFSDYIPQGIMVNVEVDTILHVSQTFYDIVENADSYSPEDTEFKGFLLDYPTSVSKVGYYEKSDILYLLDRLNTYIDERE